jgi:hypothetical protein
MQNAANRMWTVGDASSLQEHCWHTPNPVFTPDHLEFGGRQATWHDAGADMQVFLCALGHVSVHPRPLVVRRLFAALMLQDNLTG